MTFGGEVKNELCRAEVHKRCCAQAEAYGVLLYCNTFRGDEVRIVTEHDASPDGCLCCSKRPFTLPLTASPREKGSMFFPFKRGKSWI